MGVVLKCYGWSIVTTDSFSPCDFPTCSGDEEDTCQRVGYPNLDPFLLARIESTDRKATYSWNVSLEKTMREEGVDFRPPSVRSSWFWVMDNSQFGSDAESMPKRDAYLINVMRCYSNFYQTRG